MSTPERLLGSPLGSTYPVSGYGAGGELYDRLARAAVTNFIRGYVTVNLCECPRMSAYRGEYPIRVFARICVNFDHL